MFKLDFEKAEEPEIKLPTSVGSEKKQESSRKNIPSVLSARVTPDYCLPFGTCDHLHGLSLSVPKK